MTARCKKYDLSFGFSDFLCFFRLSSEIYLPRHLVWRALCHSVFFCYERLACCHARISDSCWATCQRWSISPMRKIPCFGISSHESILNENSNYIYSLRERRPFCSNELIELRSGAGLIVGHRPAFELAIKQSSKPFTSDRSTKLWTWLVDNVYTDWKSQNQRKRRVR